MKKADIEKQLAEHPDTVFRCGGSHYQIRGIVQEQGWRTDSRTWRVQPVHIGFNSETNTLNVGKETSFTMPLSKVDWIAFYNLEELEKFMIEQSIRIEKEKAEDKIRDEKFTVLSKELQIVLRLIGTKDFISVQNNGRGSVRANISMSLEDLEKLFNVLQTGIETGETK
jgi:hypothetical protein